jgi:hypothetical protein
MMSNEERATNTSNAYFDLISVMYHALEGARSYAIYMQDASNDPELAQFFQQVQQEEVRRADRAKQLLAARTQQLMGGQATQPTTDQQRFNEPGDRTWS